MLAFLSHLFVLCPKMVSERIFSMILWGKKWDQLMCSSLKKSWFFLSIDAVFVFIQLETLPDLHTFWNREYNFSFIRQSLSIFLQIPSVFCKTWKSWDFLRHLWLNPLSVLVVSPLLQLWFAQDHKMCWWSPEPCLHPLSVNLPSYSAAGVNFHCLFFSCSCGCGSSSCCPYHILLVPKPGELGFS